MLKTFLFLTLLILKSNTQLRGSSNNAALATLEEENVDDSIIQLFNYCKCVMFYLCDEQNFIIPPEEVSSTKVQYSHSLRNIKRLRCSNKYYFCCRERTATTTPSPDIQRPSCGQGVSSSRALDEFPWTVAIFRKRDRPPTESDFKCGGALIHPRVVLTGQHCVRSSTIETIQITANNERLDPSRALSRRASKIIKHEGYYSGGLYNDIALVILEEPLANINPLCLPKLNQNFDGMRCVAAGWGGSNTGTSRVLRKIDLPIVGDQSCQNLLRSTRLGPYFTLHSSFLCAGGEVGKDTCQGDGGSPLMCLQNGRYVQVGIVSWGVDCGTNVPSLYTNVAKFRNWIDERLRGENIVISANN